ncbi:MAG: site-2 protease family protein [Chloroflexota bacterium]
MLFGDFDPVFFLINALILFIALPIHEFAHAWTANYFGDDTPRLYGRLTLNPLAHLDPMGSLMMIFVGFGWAKPVPVNPYALQRRSESAYMWVSLAGPLSNLLQALFGAVIFRVLWNVPALRGVELASLLFQFVAQFIWINLALMVFNLLPLAPLDGDKVADYLMPPGWAKAWANIRPYGPFILLMLILLGRLGGFNILGVLIQTPTTSLFNLLIGQ